jgi:hypothetical protein
MLLKAWSYRLDQLSLVLHDAAQQNRQMGMYMGGDPVASGRRLDATKEPMLGHDQQRGRQQGDQQPPKHGAL